MGVKNLGSGDFQFPREFGFSGSSAGNVNPRQHPQISQDEFGDDAALKAESDAPPVYAKGGRAPKLPKAAKAVMGALQIGKAIGQRQAAAASPAPMGAPPAMAPPGAAPVGGPPGGPMPMRRGGGVKQNFNGGDHQSDSAAERSKSNAASQFKPAEEPYPAEAAKGGFIKKAIRHPGRETSRAKASGRSVHAQMEHDKHSSNPSLRAAGNLGLRLTGGDLHKGKR